MNRQYLSVIKEIFISFWYTKRVKENYDYHPDTNKFLLTQIKSYYKSLAIVAILIILITLITLPLPYLMGLIIDKVFIEKDFSKFIKYTTFFSFLVIISILINFSYDLILTKLNQNITSKIQSNIIVKILSFSTSQLNKFHSAYLISRVNEAAPISIFIVRNVVTNFSDILRIIGCFSFLSVFNLKLTIIVFLTLPLEIIFLLKSLRLTKGTSNMFYEAQAKYQGLLHDRISNMELVRLFSNEKHEVKKILGEFNTFLREDLKLQLTNSLSSIFSSSISNLQQILLLIFGGLEILNGNLSVGQYFSFIYYLKILISPIKSISNFFRGLQNAKISASRIIKIINQPSDIINPAGYTPRELKGHIKFENVYFGYFEETSEQKKYVLNNMSFEVLRGQKVLIKGVSGSGKSTIINLIMGLYKIQSGRILIDNFDINKYNLIGLRKRIGIVSQNALFFNDTILNNLRYGDINKTDDEILRISKKTCCYDFIKDIPNQFESNIIERGKNLSGGQKQRLSIARVLLKNPDILIFDEFDNHLDFETYSEIWQNIFKLVQDKTIIFITHNEPIIKIDNIISLNKDHTQIEIIENYSNHFKYKML